MVRGTRQRKIAQVWHSPAQEEAPPTPLRFGDVKREFGCAKERGPEGGRGCMAVVREGDFMAHRVDVVLTSHRRLLVHAGEASQAVCVEMWARHLRLHVGDTTWWGRAQGGDGDG